MIDNIIIKGESDRKVTNSIYTNMVGKQTGRNGIEVNGTENNFEKLILEVFLG